MNPYDRARGQSAEIISNQAYHATFKKDETFVPEIRGRHVGRYFYQWDSEYYISYGNWLAAAREPRFFSGPRIVFREILGTNFVCTFIDESIIIDRSLYIAIPKNEAVINSKYALSLLGSKLMAYYFRYSNNEFDALFPKIRLSEFKDLPIPNITPAEQQPFFTLADQLLAGQRTLHAADADFATLLRAELGLAIPLSGKLALTQEWKPWSTALQRGIGRDLNLKEKGEWLKHHMAHQQAQAAARQHLAQLDKDLDKLVYDLYQLTPAEIALVKGTSAELVS